MADRLNVGDRIVYTADETSALKGEAGTIANVYPTTYTIEWDRPVNSSIRNVKHENVTRVASPTKDEIDKALETLRAAGEVTFKPRKPPFEPVNVGFVGDYKAIVAGDHVKVGCQRIEFNEVEKVYEAVQKARAYAKENA